MGFERSIVFDQPGTTRDLLSVDTAIGGWPIRLFDTAGLRQTDEPIENEGIERALREAESADMVLLVTAIDQPWDIAAEGWRLRFPSAMLVHNKADLPPAGDRPTGLSISAHQPSGLIALLEVVGDALLANEPSLGAPLLFNERQQKLAVAALLACEEGRVLECRELLLSVLGER